MFAAFFTVFAITLFWAVPWLPYGLDEKDYTRETAFLVILLLAASFTAFAAVWLRDHAARVETTLATWTSLHDSLGDRRRREYLYDRTIVECQRAKASGGQFSVIAIRLDVAAGQSDPISEALAALEMMVKEFDCLAAIGPQEIAVLALTVRLQEVRAFAERLSGFVAGAFGPESPIGVRTGWAVFGQDGTDAGDLIGRARARVLESAPGYNAVA